jgi:hypothetical protein
MHATLYGELGTIADRAARQKHGKPTKTKTPQSGDCGVFDLVAGTCNHLKLLFEAAA